MDYTKVWWVSVGIAVITYLALIGTLINHGTIFPDNFWGWIIAIGGAIISPIVAYKAFQKMDEEEQEANRKNKLEIDDAISSIEGFNVTIEFDGYAKREKLLIDEHSKQICFYKYKEVPKKYSYKDIIKSEVVIDGETVTSTKRAGQVGGAILGGLVAGGVGAVIGGLSGKQISTEKIKKLTLQVTINDVKNPVHTIHFYNSSYAETNRYIEKQKEVVNHCHNLITVLILQADEEYNTLQVSPEIIPTDNSSNHSEVIEELKINSSLTEELERLAQLKKQGLLSDEEFVLAKKKVIS